jgi:cysteine synthase A
MGTAKRAPAEFRRRVYDRIVETIGATPLVRIRQLARNNAAKADIPGKCEFFNRWVRPRTVSVSR